MINVLIIEDNIEKLNAIVKLIVASNLATHDGLELVTDILNARKKITEKYYDLIILDLVLPNRLGDLPNQNAGCEFLQEINQNEGYHIPGTIISLTSFENIGKEHTAYFNSVGVYVINYDLTSNVWEQQILVQLKQVFAWKFAKNNSTETNKSYLGVVCALDVEFDAIQKLPWNFIDVKIAGDPTLYIEGIITKNQKQQRVIAALCPRMGMSAAAITTIKLINAFRPEIIAMTGITGAVKGNAKLGEIIIADECWDWGMGKWLLENGVSIFNPSPSHISIDSDLRTSALRLSRNNEILHKIRDGFNGNKPANVLKINIGPVASGSAVIAVQAMTDHIKAQHRKLMGIEMESYGVYSAATEATFPRPKFISIKCASDFADDQKDDGIRHYCAYSSAEILKNLIQDYID